MSNTRKQPNKQAQDNQQQHQEPQQQKTRREHGSLKGEQKYHDHERPETRLTR